MKRKIVIATMNDHKASEIRALIGDHYDVMTQSLFSIPSVPETGKTFEENALIKADEVSQKTGLLTLADDSGLEVDLLQGNPGVYSARYAGLNATDAENNNKLLAELEEFKNERISARFKSVIVLSNPLEDSKNIFHGNWEGQIIFNPRGKNGFGYDALFYIEKLKRTAAELTQDEKNKLSHRARAMRKVTDYLTKKTLDTE
jgi:XTP/dITP diphosphohydrolase